MVNDGEKKKAFCCSRVNRKRTDLHYTKAQKEKLKCLLYLKHGGMGSEVSRNEVSEVQASKVKKEEGREETAKVAEEMLGRKKEGKYNIKNPQRRTKVE
ncbi:hypothetical protein Tco_1151623 [Tanacetum coccineum]